MTGIWARTWAAQKASRTRPGARVGADRRERGEQDRVVEGPAADGREQGLRPVVAEGGEDAVALALDPLREVVGVRVSCGAACCGRARSTVVTLCSGRVGGEQHRGERRRAATKTTRLTIRGVEQVAVDRAADQRRQGQDRQAEDDREREQVDGGDPGDGAARARRPRSTSIRYWSAAPIAPPPGAILARALPASCESITADHGERGIVSRWRIQVQPSVASCSSASNGNQRSQISRRFCQEPRTSRRLGKTR